CLRQLNDGEQLYASSLPGYSAWIASANERASSRSGVEVSNQSTSAYGAYASERETTGSSPSRTTKKPSAVRSPVTNSRSRGSTSDVSSFAESASVRATSTVGTPATSAASRAALSVREKGAVGTPPFPPRCPHFFPEES